MTGLTKEIVFDRSICPCSVSISPRVGIWWRTETLVPAMSGWWSSLQYGGISCTSPSSRTSSTTSFRRSAAQSRWAALGTPPCERTESFRIYFPKWFVESIPQLRSTEISCYVVLDLYSLIENLRCHVIVSVCSIDTAKITEVNPK